MNILNKLKELGAKFDQEQFKLQDANFVISKDVGYYENYIYFLRYNSFPSSLVFKTKTSNITDLIKCLIENNFVVSNVEMNYDRNTKELIHFSHHTDKIYINFHVSGENDSPLLVVDDLSKETDHVSINIFFDASKTTCLIGRLKKQFSVEEELKETKGKILLFEKNEYNEMVLTPHKIKGFDLDIRENYNDDFVNTHEKIEKWLTDFSIKNNKLVLLHGDPGSGKTNYIKYLLNRDDGLKKIYIPPYFVQSMADPAFFPVIRREKDSLLIIEDAEKVLINREDSSDNSVISILLNICDGIMADVLNFKIIATFNTDQDKIDPALKRRGRMFLKHNFGPLDEKKTESLFKKLYGDNKPPKPRMTLAEIYNDENDFSPKQEKRKMGFVHD